MISLPGPSTLGTFISNLNGDPFHVKSFLNVPGDSIALLTTMYFHERFFFQHISGVPRFHVRLDDV